MALWTEPPEKAEQKESPMDLAIGHAVSPPAAPAIAKDATLKNRRESVFGPGVTIEGKIEGDADLRIAGKFKGDIHIAGNLSIEKGAHLSAKINAATVTIAGELEGNIVASSQVRLAESGQMIGDLKATTLIVDAGSRMRGHVEFGWSPAEMTKHTNSRVQENNKPKTTG
jgi:cytoskeletal protein CcmA (bactofilin family)